MKRTTLILAFSAQLFTAPLLAGPPAGAPNGANAWQQARAALARQDTAAAVRLLEPLAQGGHARAQWQLGLLHHHGLGVPEDDTVAATWFERAARQGHVESQYQLANLHAYGLLPPVEGRDAAREAATWYFEAARQGHAEAQYTLGILFLTGSGVQASPTEARRWFAKAAARGHAGAKAQLVAR